MPKVLIISHNPITTYNNMGKTIRSLFFTFSQEDLCQLYIYPSLPDEEYCASYYRMTDKDVLRSYWTGRVAGREIESEEISADNKSMFEQATDEALYRNPKNKRPLRMLLRDVLWMLARWNNRSLREWLDAQKPDCIFVAPGNAKFLYNIALRIAKRLEIPIVTYVCDDYYFVRRSTGWLGRLCDGLLKRKIAQLMQKTAKIITICPSLEKLYSQRFGCPAVTVMTGASCPVAAESKKVTTPRSITYLGNIRCNRYVSLAQIGKALDNFNEQYGQEALLHIYTAEKDETILSAFEGIASVRLHGFVSGEEYERVFRESDYLLHVEAFDEASIDQVRHSVSTKIADSLASGIGLLAYGPDCVASMQYLIENECALTATSPEQLSAMLETAFLYPEQTQQTVQKALAVAAENHDAQRVGERVRAVFTSVLAERKAI